MNISDDLYSAQVTEQDDTYIIEVPKREVQRGNVQLGETYRVALVSSTVDESVSKTDTQDKETAERNSQSHSRDGQTVPPVSEGEIREVEIENLGDRGDGITRIDGGYVVIVPDTEVGERVTIRLDDVQENVGFAEVVKRQHDPTREW
jgi:predicted RNA-binding protein with TRAM domain